MRNPDINKVYYLEHLSKKQRKKLFKNVGIEHSKYMIKKSKYFLAFINGSWGIYDFNKGYKPTTNAKELFGSQGITEEASLNQVPDDSKLVENHIEQDLEMIDSKSKNNFKDITDSISDLLEYKNEKYGNTILEPLNIFSGKSKAGHEIDKKLSRVKNSKELRKNDVVDIIGYLVLTCKEFGWNNFDEFKD